MKQKVAYLIQAHNDFKHLKRLVQRLNDHADFFIHIDKKTNITPFVEEINYPNVFFIEDSKRYKVYWAGFSQVEATLAMIEKCLQENERNDVDYKKIVLISGADYPIKSNDHIHSFFDNHQSINFIRGMNITQANQKKYNDCICNYRFFNFFLINILVTRITRKGLGMIVSFFKKKPNYFIDKNNKKLDIFHGSSWWGLNVDVVKYIFEFNRNNPKFSTYFKYSMASDEKYFHTLFFNSQFSKSNLSQGEEPFIPATAAFANLHIIDDSLQKWFIIDDFNQIKYSDRLFVRKVSSNYSKELLDKIDEELL